MAFTSYLTTEDKENIYLWASQGISYTKIAELIENRVSRQRICQICKKKGVDSLRIRVEKAEQDRADKMSAKWGKNWEDADWRKSELLQAMRSKFKNKKNSAMYSKWAFTISFDDLDWPTACPILGIEIDYFSVKVQENSPSFDRIDSNIGYVKGNVALVSWRANRIKNDGTAEEHHKIAAFMELYK
jgi:hypothetical protein